jgi:hypothetical protein
VPGPDDVFRGRGIDGLRVALDLLRSKAVRSHLVLLLVCGTAACSDPGGGEDTEASSGSSAGDAGDDADDAIADMKPPPPEGCEDGILEGAIYLERGPEELDRLQGIGTITGDVVIDKTDAQSLEGFECIVEIGGDLQIFGNAALTDLHGLDNLWRVKKHVVISENAALTDIDALSGLTHAGAILPDEDTGQLLRVGGLVVKSNPSLGAISGLGSLREVTGSLIIQFNEALENIDGLEGLRVVDGLFAVTHNPSLCLSSINGVGARITEGPDEGSSTRSNDPGC